METNDDERVLEMEAEYEFLTMEATKAEEEYLAARQIVDDAKDSIDLLRSEILSLAAKGIEFKRLTVTHTKRKGNVDMKKLQRKFNIMDSEIDECRKAKISFDTIKINAKVNS